MELYLKTLTPLHIGTGEAFSALDYVIHDRMLYKISQKQFGVFLAQHRDLINPFSKWAIEISKDLEEIKANKTYRGQALEKRDMLQKRSDIQRDFNLLKFCNQHGKGQVFLDFLKKNEGIQAIPIKARDGKLKQQIRGQIMIPGEQKAYLPGSSLKGAIRTALIFESLSQHGQAYKQKILSEIRSTLRMPGKPSKIAKLVGKEIEYSCCYCGVKSRRRGEERTSFQDEKFDLLKFLVISDAMPVRSDTAMEVVNTDLYLVNRVKDRRTRDMHYKATRQKQSPAIEAVSAGQAFSCEVNFQLASLFQIYKRKIPGTWIKLEEKVKELFGLDLQSVTRQNLKEKQQETEAYIYAALSRFTQAQLDFEDKWLTDSYLQHDLDRGQIRLEAEDLRKPFDKLKNYSSETRTLMRVGFGAGFANKTTLLYMLTDVDFRQALVAVMEKFKIGNKPGQRGGRRYEPNLKKFPKSRTLVSYERQVSPLGWLEWIPKGDWKEDAEFSITSDPQSSVGTDTPRRDEKIIPQYPTKPIRKGSILDAYVFPSSKGKEKRVQVYIGKGKDIKMTISFPADFILGKIVLVEVREIRNGQVTAVGFKRLKKENRR